MLIHVKAVHYDFYKRRINELCAMYPELFNKQFPWPLAIGIHRKLAEETSFSPAEIKVLLRIWTHRFEYLAMGQSVGSRMDLKGALSLMSPEHVGQFVQYHKRMRPASVLRFAKHFHKRFGNPAFIAVPVKERHDH